jgi:two-component system cell cycle response regulator
MEKTSRFKILIADDSPISRRLLEAFLIKRDYEVITATDGVEALRILSCDDGPRLAILDWMMPGLEGTRVCRKLREQPEDKPYVYVLLLTARTEKADLLDGLGSGADDYLTKPFDPAELYARLSVGRRILDLQDKLIAAGDELRFRASHDTLTGVSNRAVILDTLRREQSRQLREGGSFGIIMLDIDHFKRVNDTYGHLCGDAVLQGAANIMQASLRPYDVVGRYGGEEFLMVVPRSDAPSALRVAERIREAIAAKPFITSGGEVRVTVSLGVAASTDLAPAEPQHLLQMADDALYRAKQNGRNRSELAVASPLPDAALLESKSK